MMVERKCPTCISGNCEVGGVIARKYDARTFGNVGRREVNQHALALNCRWQAPVLKQLKAIYQQSYGIIHVSVMTFEMSLDTAATSSVMLMKPGPAISICTEHVIRIFHGWQRTRAAPMTGVWGMCSMILAAMTLGAAFGCTTAASFMAAAVQ